MVSPQAVEKLTQLGVFPKTVGVNAEIFERCSTLETITQEAINLGWSCGSGQFVYFHLGEMLKDEKYKSSFLKKAKEELGSSGISSDHILEYYQSGADPGLVFSIRHGEYIAPVRKAFYERANQFSLNQIREWLGYR